MNLISFFALIFFLTSNLANANCCRTNEVPNAYNVVCQRPINNTPITSATRQRCLAAYHACRWRDSDPLCRITTPTDPNPTKKPKRSSSPER
jgi:hypothetical protein